MLHSGRRVILMLRHGQCCHEGERDELKEMWKLELSRKRVRIMQRRCHNKSDHRISPDPTGE